VIRVSELSDGDAYRQLGNLGALLIDAVEGGASVSFMADLRRDEAEAFWVETIEGIPSGRTLLFAALEGSGLLGAVLLHPVMKPNQPHRADVAKLLVMRGARRRGIATLLMDALEARALELGRTLLTLDTVTGSGAEPFYRGRGFVAAGIIPDYALMPDGAFCATTVFYKRLARIGTFLNNNL
jgi:GNAT superfamily N-acetyltransferase